MMHNPNLINDNFTEEYDKDCTWYVFNSDKEACRRLNEICDNFRSYFMKGRFISFDTPWAQIYYHNQSGKKVTKVPFEVFTTINEHTRFYLFMSEEDFQVLTHTEMVRFCKTESIH